MDFFQDLDWQPQSVKSSFDPSQTLVHGNRFNVFVGSPAFVAPAHKSAELFSFEAGQGVPFPPTPASNSACTLSDDDEFGDFESVPAVTEVAAEMEDSSSQKVPPPPAGLLMFRVHGLAIPSALHNQINSVDPLASIHTRSRHLESKFEFGVLDSDPSPSINDARDASLLNAVSDISGVQLDKLKIEVDESLADFDDVDWGDFVQPPGITVASVQIHDKISPDPNPTGNGSRPSVYLPDKFSEVRTEKTENLASMNLKDILEKPNDNAGSVRLEVAMPLSAPSRWSVTASSKVVSSNLSNEVVGDMYRSMNISDNHKEVTALNTSTSNGNSGAVGVNKFSEPISLSVFGDDDYVDEDLLFEDEFRFKPQSTSHKRSASSSAIPSEALDGYIGSLYTQFNGSHQRHQSWSTGILNGADGDEPGVGTANQIHSSTPNGEMKGSSTKQVKKVFQDENKLKIAIMSQVLESASVEDQHVYIQAWNALARVCASELSHGHSLWQKAKSAGMCSLLLSDSKGRSYFIALGQIYIVNVILGVAANFYSSWLEVVSDQGKALKAELQQCKMDWLDFKDAVYSAIVEFEGPSSLLDSWKSLDRLYSIGEALGADSFDQECSMLCQLSLLPLQKSFGVPAVKWGKDHYFLPLANLWANLVAPQPPQLPRLF